MLQQPLPPPGIPILRGPLSGPPGGWLPNYALIPPFDLPKQYLHSSADSASESSELSVCPPSSSDSSERGSGGTSPQSFATSSDSAGDLQVPSAHVGGAGGTVEEVGSPRRLCQLNDRIAFDDRCPGRRLSVRVTYGPGCAGGTNDDAIGGGLSSREQKAYLEQWKATPRCYQVCVPKRSRDSGDATSSDYSDFENHTDQQWYLRALNSHSHFLVMVTTVTELFQFQPDSSSLLNPIWFNAFGFQFHTHTRTHTKLSHSAVC